MNILLKKFFTGEKATGTILILCTLLSLFLANSSLSKQYITFFDFHIAGHSIIHWINDGLMAIFFLYVGLELEREIYDGELSTFKNASLPLFAAIGGMILPAAFYMWFNVGTTTQSGAGIPMATDIAFALGILSLLGKRVPASLKVFLTALAVIDDLGAILIIAIFYTKELAFSNLIIAVIIFFILITLNLLKVKQLFIYLIGGGFLWYFMLQSGVHATIAGVLLAFAIPFSGGRKSLSYKLEHFLKKPVFYFILPLFALANTAIIIGSEISQIIVQNYGLGIATGLILGKPIGIFLFSVLAVKLKIGVMPKGIKWTNILGVGFLAGIGFTMSIFIALLAFDNQDVINNSKLVILISSLVAASVGFILLRVSLNNPETNLPNTP